MHLLKVGIKFSVVQIIADIYICCAILAPKQVQYLTPNQGIIRTGLLVVEWVSCGIDTAILTIYKYRAPILECHIYKPYLAEHRLSTPLPQLIRRVLLRGGLFAVHIRVRLFAFRARANAAMVIPILGPGALVAPTALA